MGSGSSKEQKDRDSRRVNAPVANVNNPDQRQTQSDPRSAQHPSTTPRTFITQQEDVGEVEDIDSSDRNAWQPQQTVETSSELNPGHRDASPDRPTWKVDEEAEAELNEVLRVPTNPRQNNNNNNNKAPKDRGSRPVHVVNPVQKEDLPETYAQRKQREQYTLNQQMLLRQKTIYRDPENWRDQRSEEDQPSAPGSFDASRFRSANQGKSMKANLFTTNANREEAVQFDHGRSMDEDIDITPSQHASSREIPTYNASEQDLMAALERELM